jgi:hypothetical protein
MKDIKFSRATGKDLQAIEALLTDCQRRHNESLQTARWPVQLRFAVHAAWSRAPEP